MSAALCAHCEQPIEPLKLEPAIFLHSNTGSRYCFGGMVAETAEQLQQRAGQPVPRLETPTPRQRWEEPARPVMTDADYGRFRLPNSFFEDLGKGPAYRSLPYSPLPEDTP